MSRDRVAAAVLLAFGLGGAVETRRLTFGDPGHPGPGFFPFWLALALCVVALVLLLRPSVAAPRPAAAPPERPRRGKVVLALVAAAAYAFLLAPLGFLLSTFAFILFLLAALESRPWVSSLTIAAATAIACHVVFKVWLAVQLPAGPWGF